MHVPSSRYKQLVDFKRSTADTTVHECRQVEGIPVDDQSAYKYEDPQRAASINNVDTDIYSECDRTSADVFCPKCVLCFRLLWILAMKKRRQPHNFSPLCLKYVYKLGPGNQPSLGLSCSCFGSLARERELLLRICHNCVIICRILC